MRDLRRDPADGRQAFGPEQGLPLGAQLPLARRQPLCHGIELAREHRELVAALFRNGDRLRAAAAEALGGFGERPDRPQRALGEPHHEQSDEERDPGECHERPARRALLLLRLVDAAVHLVLQVQAQVLHLVVDDTLYRPQPGNPVLQRGVRTARRLLQASGHRVCRRLLFSDVGGDVVEADRDPVQHVAIGRRPLGTGDELLRGCEALADGAGHVRPVASDEAGPRLGVGRVEQVVRVSHAQLVKRVEGRDGARERHVGSGKEG